jgi:hypothetical protein
VSHHLRPRTWAPAVLLTVGALALPASPAFASRGQESVFQDDPQVLTGSDSQIDARMATLQRLGVDRIRVSMLWRAVAPAEGSTTRPAFGPGGASNPAAYPKDAFFAYDRLLTLAARHGLQVYFCITGPAPLWATANPNKREGQANPRSSEYRAFVTAVGQRYSGTYPAPKSPTRAGPTLPRVSMWSLYNEPNQPGWLRPQAVRVGRKVIPRSPRLYRSLEENGYAALRATGHGRDRILLAETAPRGSKSLGRTSPMRPLLFIRELYCLDRRTRPYRGKAAKARGCPTTRSGRRKFVGRHPGLFRSSAWAHHPYALELPPQFGDRTRDQVTLAVLPRLTRTLDRIFRRYHKRRRLGIWLTEYGYQSRPPDPFTGFRPKVQAAYINQGEYMAYRYRRVRSMSQFLLVDEPPDTSVSPGNPRYWGSTFQTGLVQRSGRRKPAFGAYQRPAFASPQRVRGGGRVRVWGGLRSAPNGRKLSGKLQFRARGARKWKSVRRFSTRNFHNYVTVNTRARKGQRHTGYYRLLWRNPAGGKALTSRATYVKLRR